MQKIQLSELEGSLAELIRNVSRNEERFIILDGKEVVAGLVSPSDLDNLAELDELTKDIERHKEIQDLLKGMIGAPDEDEKER